MFSNSRPSLPGRGEANSSLKNELILYKQRKEDLKHKAKLHINKIKHDQLMKQSYVNLYNIIAINKSC